MSIDGNKSTLTGTGRVYFKYHTSIFAYRLIDQFIDRFINVQTKWKEGHISRTVGIRTHYLTDISILRRIPLSTDTNRGVTVTGMGRLYFQLETSILTY